VVVKTWGTPREEPELINHVDLVSKLGIADLEKGTAIAGAPWHTSSIGAKFLSICIKRLSIGTPTVAEPAWQSGGSVCCGG